MPHILLLGAGFSHNWGAPLAARVTGSLLSDLHDDPVLERALRRTGASFEDVMADFFKPTGKIDESHQRLQKAVTGLFDRMNQSLITGQFEFNNYVENSVKGLLERFDAIFTLNQDLLLEHHYCQHIVSPKLNAVVVPGMQPSYEHGHPPLGDVTKLTWRPTGDHTIPPRTQPYFKLHGSSNWKLANDDTVMIMGSAKAAAIPRFSVLHWYQDEFRRYLHQPRTKLMVIGYSFRDEHINSILVNAHRKAKLQMYIVDVAGMEVLRAPPAERALVGYMPRETEELKVIGETRTPLSQVLNGKNKFERDELFRFFN